MELIKGKTYINIDKESEYYNKSFILEELIGVNPEGGFIIKISEKISGFNHWWNKHEFKDNFVSLDVIREKKIKDILREK